MPQLRPFVRVWLPVSLIFTLGLTLPIIKKATAGGRNEPIVVLQTSEGPLQTGAPVSALFTSPAEENTVYLVDGFNGQVEAYKDDPTPSLRPFADTSGPLAIRSRDYFAYIDGRSKIVLAVPMGKTIGRIDTPPAISVALLSNGNIIVASPHEKHFLHMYSSSGRLLKRFGKMKRHKATDHAQNEFLHKGKLLIDDADHIYYVYHYLPLIQKFKPSGELDLEIEVKGDAIDIQQELAERFFNIRAPGTAGGITIINSATLDPKTGRLWIGLNGSSTTGVIYEYNRSGEKLREYSLEVKTPSGGSNTILAARDIAIAGPILYVLTDQHQVFRFPRSIGARRSEISRFEQMALTWELPIQWRLNREKRCGAILRSASCLT